MTCISFCGAEGGQIHKHKAVDQRRKPSQDRPKKELFVEAASLQCVRLEICKRMGNPRIVAPAAAYLLCVCYAFWLCEARAEPTYRAAIAAAPGYANAHSNLPDIHRARRRPSR